MGPLEKWLKYYSLQEIIGANRITICSRDTNDTSWHDIVCKITLVLWYLLQFNGIEIWQMIKGTAGGEGVIRCPDVNIQECGFSRATSATLLTGIFSELELVRFARIFYRLNSMGCGCIS